MTYIDGLVLPVKAGIGSEAYVAFAGKDRADPAGSSSRLGDDMPDGTLTDFRRSVQAAAGETVVFSWVEWPDKATCDAGMKAVREDPRMEPTDVEMPVDGKRMIFGGFQLVLDA